MNPIELFFGLLLVAVAIALVAKRLDQPYPIALVLGGLALSLIPNVPRFRLDPQVVFLLFLPPILGEAAYFTSWREFWRYKRPIFLLAFGLVTATSAAVAAVCAWLIPGMTWGLGFTLGAIVSPPDAAAATSITRGLRLPRRIVQILEGESLVNDAAGLVIYRFAVAAVVTGVFSWQSASLTLLWVTFGGAGIGILTAKLYVKLYPLLKDPEVEIISTFFLTYSSYFIAEAVHASGVLSTVAAGLILGWHAPSLFSAQTRIRATAVWQSVIFVINALVFFLIGLQLPHIWNEIRDESASRLALWSALVVAAVMLVRLAWMFPGAYLPRLLSRRIRETEPQPPWQWVVVTGWTGLRGVVSLAAALALPFDFPKRDLILLLSFAVILATLLFQGLTLRSVICWLGVNDDGTSEVELLKARLHVVERVVDRVAAFEREQSVPATVLERVRGYHEDRLAVLRAQLANEVGAEAQENPGEFNTLAEQRLWWELARVERQAVLDLRRQKLIGDEALHQIQNELDLLEARLVPR